MAMTIGASIMASQPTVMVPRVAAAETNRISQDSSKELGVQRITPQNSETLNAIPSRTIPLANTVNSSSSASSTTSSTEASPPSQEELSAQQQVEQVISQLKARDREVRVHEQAHLSAAGQYATSGASFSYQTGPDGKRYAVGGEVGIDTSPIANDPEATLQKAMVVQSAALAPAQPSTQDLRVASAAAQMMTEARAQIAEQRTEQADAPESRADAENQTQATDNSSDSYNRISPANNQSVNQNDFASVVQQEMGMRQLAVERTQFETRLSLNSVRA
ncbi:hypothetical protein THMIRHAS_05120 [Thiosulfatimonas sediminis]|uniref:SprA-related family protein n=1 Tax=Thiosulfatimonas sediminis TaxID=2675054 RepID=A0A6F8PSQ7_9GAMM|nr:putative metalloprotease CJM1_0395 family protein [Thiosulfatimonas sediminis]BBP45139.1 hypothetical protein THMIRHAS_05120 [Thiosulfatimonas sediminis]